MDLLKERTGSIGAFLMLQLLIYSIFVGIIASSTIDLQSSYFSGLSAGRVELEAQQWAEIKANTVRLIGYDDITNQSRQSIDGSNGRWEDEVIVDEAVQIGPDEDNKQKIVTIKVYNPSDITSKFDLKVPLSSQGTGSIPKGAILPWFGNIADIPNGWSLCDGSNGTPDLRDRYLKGSGLESLGITGGNNQVTLTVANLPKEQSNILNSIGNFYSPKGARSELEARNWIDGEGHMTYHTMLYLQNIGSVITTGWNSVPINNQPAYMTVHYIMKI